MYCMRYISAHRILCKILGILCKCKASVDAACYFAISA